jgi:hypothetical protein
MVKKRLGEMLIEAGVIDEAQLQAALGHQRKWGGKLGQALLDLKLASEPQIVSALSRKFGYEMVNVASMPRTAPLEAALKLVPRELAMRQMLLPIACDTNSLTVAMADPSNIAVVDELSFRTGRRIKIVLGGDREIAAAVRRLYYADEEQKQSSLSAISIDEGSGVMPIETTRDPFAAMPDYVREGYFKRPASTLADPPAAPARPQQIHPLVNPPVRQQPPPPMPMPMQQGYPPAPPMGPNGYPMAAPSNAPYYPPQQPTYGRGQERTDGLGEPILATELAPADIMEGPFEGPPQRGPAPPRAPAIYDILERLVRGEESGIVRPGHLAAALARVLLKRGLVREAELLEELSKRS